MYIHIFLCGWRWRWCGVVWFVELLDYRPHPFCHCKVKLKSFSLRRKRGLQLPIVKALFFCSVSFMGLSLVWT